jgi:hypothetical protein
MEIPVFVRKFLTLVIYSEKQCQITTHKQEQFNVLMEWKGRILTENNPLEYILLSVPVILFHIVLYEIV